jgi:AcrR family transcriptional regulator
MAFEESNDRDTTRTARRYSSPRRKQQAAETRAAVLEAALVQFSERGWSATGMRDIANMAGVSVETVYANFASKTRLLKAALDIAVVGDDKPIPLAQRSEFDAMARGTLEERAQAAARVLSSVHSQTKGLQRALREGAAADPELARVLQENEERRRIDVGTGMELVYGRRPDPTQRDGLWALAGFEVYELLIERAGWSTARYQSWLAGLIILLAAD